MIRCHCLPLLVHKLQSEIPQHPHKSGLGMGTSTKRILQVNYHPQLVQTLLIDGSNWVVYDGTRDEEDQHQQINVVIYLLFHRSNAFTIYHDVVEFTWLTVRLKWNPPHVKSFRAGLHCGPDCELLISAGLFFIEFAQQLVD